MTSGKTMPDDLGIPLDDIDEQFAMFTGREWTFRRIDDWLIAGGRRFLLTGPPGSGKSLVAARLVHASNGHTPILGQAALTDGWLTYAHFCRARDPFSLNPVTFVERLCERLAALSEDFRRALLERPHPNITVTGHAEAVSVQPGATVAGVKIVVNIHDVSPAMAFDEAVRKPLEKLGDTGIGRPVAILIDGLDEAAAVGGQSLVELLSQLLHPQASLPTGIKFLVTARTGEVRIRDRLGDPDLDLVADAPLEAHDVEEYVARRLAAFPRPTRQVLASRVAAASEGVFLYARYVADYLLAQPEAVTDTMNNLPLPRDLTDVYREFLTRELVRDRRDEDWQKRFRPVLGLLAVAKGQGLSLEQITGAAQLLSSARQSQLVDALQACGQFLTMSSPEGPFRIFHESFRDFLLKEPQFQVFPQEASRSLAAYLVGRWEGNWRQCNDRYALEYTPRHLMEAIKGAPNSPVTHGLQAALANLLKDLAFIETRSARSGLDRILDDLRAAVEIPGMGDVDRDRDHALSGDRDVVSELDDVLHVLDRSVPDLRPWDADVAPSGLCQQIVLHAQEVGATWLAEAARARLEGIGESFFEADWRTSQESDALERVLVGHGGPVVSIALTPDSGRILSGSVDHTSRLWDLRTGEVLRVLEGHDGPVSAVALIGEQLAITGSLDGTVRSWDLAAAQEQFRLDAGGDGVRSLAVTQDGTRAVTGGLDGTVCVWDLEARVALCQEVAHAGEVKSLVLTQDETIALSAGADDDAIGVWEIATGRRLDILHGHEESVSALAVSGDDIAVSASGDGTLRIWDIQTRQCRHVLDRHDLRGSKVDVRSVAIEHTARRAISVAYDYTLRVWNLDTGEEFAGMQTDRAMDTVTIAPDGSMALITSLMDFIVRVVDLRSLREVSLLGGHGSSVMQVLFTPDSTKAVTASFDGTIRVWNLRRLDPLSSVRGHNGAVIGVCITTDQRYALSGSHDDTLRVWDIGTGEQKLLYRRIQQYINTIAQLPDPNWVVTGSAMGELAFFPIGPDAPSFMEAYNASAANYSFGDAEHSVSAIVVLPDGRRLISASYHDPEIRVWDLATGAETARLRGHTEGVYDLAVTHDGRRLVSSSADHTVRVWNLLFEQTVFVLHGHTDKVGGVTVTPDGQTAASASDDGSIRIWDLEHGTEIGKLSGHKAAATAITVLDHGRSLLSGGSDRWLLGWDLQALRQDSAVRLNSAINSIATMGDIVIVGDGAGDVYCLRFRASSLTHS